MNMQEISLQVVENFLPNFYQYRDWALNLEYGTREYKNEKYINVSSDWGKFPTQLLSSVMQFPVQSTLSFIRYNTKDIGSVSTPFIHSDLNIDGATWASVLYLSTPEQDLVETSGTAFWRHKDTGLRTMPGDPNLLLDHGFTSDIIEKINKDGYDESNWKLEGFTSMKSNRLIIYPASVFHSRYPNHSFGEDAKTGRLIWVNFFREA